MLKKLEMNIPNELLKLSGVEVEEIFLRDNHELVIKVKSVEKGDLPGSLCIAKIFDFFLIIFKKMRYRYK